MSNDRNIDHLHPLLEPICQEFMRQCDYEGIKAFITFTWRPADEQDSLYAQGRTKPGKIVTNATSKNSKHCFTLNGKPAAKAFDIAIKDDDGAIIKDGSHPLYTRAGRIGEDLDLIWGGTFRKLGDSGHFEIP
jgi:peptidoglycan L-alanyl-D-glutamate endopeptidase CwlK